jgi:hypothetical protein
MTAAAARTSLIHTTFTSGKVRPIRCFFRPVIVLADHNVAEAHTFLALKQPAKYRDICAGNGAKQGFG